MTLEEAIEQLENPNVHTLTFNYSELTKWLEELKEARRLLPLANADIYYYSGKKWEHEADVLKLIGGE